MKDQKEENFVTTTPADKDHVAPLEPATAPRSQPKQRSALHRAVRRAVCRVVGCKTKRGGEV